MLITKAVLLANWPWLSMAVDTYVHDIGGVHRGSKYNQWEWVIDVDDPERVERLLSQFKAVEIDTVMIGECEESRKLIEKRLGVEDAYWLVNELNRIALEVSKRL